MDWFDPGVQRLTSGKYSEAIECFKNSLSIYQEKGDKEKIADCYYGLGECYRMLDKYSEAVTTYEKSLSIYQGKDDQKKSAPCYYGLGVCYKMLKKYSEAVTNYERSLSIYQEKGDQERVAQCYRGLGDSYRVLERHSEAVTNYEQSLSNISNPKMRETLEGDVSYGLGASLMHLYRFQESKEYFDKALIIAEDIGGLKLEWMCIYCLSSLHYKQSQFHQALNYAERAEDIANKMNSTEEKQLSYQILSHALVSLGRVKDAIEYNKQYLKYNEQVGNKKEEGRSCFGLSVCFIKIHDNDNAIFYAEKSAKIAKETGDLETEGKAYGSIGSALSETGKLREAKEYNMKALEIAQQSGDKQSEENTLNNLGDVSMKLGRHYDAIRYFETSINVNSDLGLQNNNGAQYNNLGALYSRVGKYHEAAEFLEQSLDIAKDTSEISIEIHAYQNLSQVYYQLNSFKLASQCRWKSIILAIRTGDKRGEMNYFQCLGICFGKTGNIKAINSEKKALDLALKIKVSEHIYNCYANVGTTYFHSGMMYEAIHVSEKALKICTDSGHKRNEAFCRHNMGKIYHGLSRKQTLFNDHEEYARNIETSEQYYRESLHCYEELFDDLREKHEIKILIVDTYVEAYNNLALLLIETNRTTEALIVCERGRACTLGDTLVCKYGMQQQQALVENMSTRKPLNESDLTDLLPKQSCLLFYSIIYDSEHLWVLSQQRSLIYAQNDMQQISITTKNLTEYIKQLVDSMDVREMAANCEDRSLGKREPCYSEGDDYQSQLSNSIARMALEQDIIDSEYSRRKPKERRINPPESTSTESDQHIDTKEQLKDLFLITPVEEHLTQHEVIIIPDGSLNLEPCYSERDDNRTQLTNSITRRTLEHDVTDSEYSRRNPKERRRNPPESTSIGSDQHIETTEPLKELFLITPVEEHLTQDEVIIIPDGPLNMESCYSEGDDDRSQLSNSITKRTLEQNIIESEYSRRNPEKRRRNPPESTSNGSEQHIDTTELLKELFKQLITPVQEHLTQDEIIIIPDGPLNMVPFAALQDPKTGRFLCETKRIRLAPSLTTLKILKECPDDYQSKEGALVIGNPLVGEVMFHGKKKKFASLPAAENEATAFSPILGVSPLIGIHATKDAVREKLQDGAAVIHIAAHGDAFTGEIALAPGISAQSKVIPEEEDYILTMQEVQEIGVRAKLVVLNCCHSGRGEIRAEGVVGMARAFLAAGARAVVASLWAIDDAATLDFMAGFYNRLIRHGKSASVSLNESMNDLLVEKKFSHPMYWAPFVLIGDDVTISYLCKYS